MRRLVAGHGFVLLIILGLTCISHAYPDRPINLIIPYPAGGATDAGARAMVPFLEKYLGGQFLVLNRAGAGGELGFAEIAKAPADGYTIGFINTPNVLTIPIERKAKYRMENFAPLANILDDPNAIAVRKESKFTTLREVVDFAKANPGAMTYGTTGIGSDDHLAGLKIERLTGVKLTHVPFSGGAQVRQSLMGGHIELGIYNMAEMVGDIRNGLVRPLGQMSEQRWEEAADVPTFREQGFDLVISAARGIAAPAGIPSAVRDQLALAIEKTLADPAFLAIAKKHPLPLKFMNASNYAAWLAQQQIAFQKLWDETPWK